MIATRHRPWPIARVRCFRAFLALVVSPVAAFLLLELIVRLVGNFDFHGVDYVEQDPELHWANAPGMRSEIVGFDYRFTISFNSLGMRGPEPRDGAAARVLMLGDSYVLGLGVNDDETIAANLQRQLDDVAPGRFDVVNGGVAGYGAQQSLRLARRHWDRLRPSVLVWFHCGNDFSDDWNFTHGTWGTLRSKIPGRRFMLEHSEAWSLIKPGALSVLSLLSIRRSPIKLEGKGEATLASDLGARWVAGRDLTFGALDALDDFRREHGARLFVTSVGFNPKAAEERLSRDASAVRARCQEKSLPFIGPPDPTAAAELESWVNPSTIGHWSPAASRLFATRLFDALKEARVF